MRWIIFKISLIFLGVFVKSKKRELPLFQIRLPACKMIKNKMLIPGSPLFHLKKQGTF